MTHSLRRGPGSPSLRKLQKLVRDERGRKYLVIIVGGSTTGALYLHSRSSWSEMAAPRSGQAAQRFHSSVWISNAIVHSDASD